MGASTSQNPYGPLRPVTGTPLPFLPCIFYDLTVVANIVSMTKMLKNYETYI
jgi:hypothetical protein